MHVFAFHLKQNEFNRKVSFHLFENFSLSNDTFTLVLLNILFKNTHNNKIIKIDIKHKLIQRKPLKFELSNMGLGRSIFI